MSNWRPGDPERRRRNQGGLDRMYALELEINNLKIAVNNYQESTDVLIKQMAEMLQSHNVEIHGDRQGKGLKERINYLQEDADNRKSHIKILTTATIGVFVNMVVQWIKNSLK